jgi:hypothetical protein
LNTGGGFTCVDLQTDENNCGMVGRACIDDELCVAGECQCGSVGMRCGVGTACCGGSCISTTDDPENCGGCGRLCTPNAPDCVESMCVCGEAGRACDEPVVDLISGTLGESCCPGRGCVANSDEDCNCAACTGSDECVVGGSGLFPTPGGDEAVNVCCGDPLFTPLLGCGGFGFPGGDGGIPFPGLDGGLPGFEDGGIVIPGLDGGLPSFDGSLPGLDGGVP